MFRYAEKSMENRHSKEKKRLQVSLSPPSYGGMKKANTILLLLSLPLLLTNCSSKSDSGESESLPSTYNESVKSYLKALAKIHNYTLEESVSSDASAVVNTLTVTFGKDFYYYDPSYEDTYGLISCDDGVYRVHLNGKTMVGGELYRDDEGNAYKDLWDGHFFPSFADLTEENIDSIKDEGKENVSITGKKNRLALLNLLGLGSSYYGGITSFKGTIKSDNSLSLALEVSDTSGASITVKAEVSNLLTSYCTKIDNYRASKTYFVIDEDFAKARKLIKANNYTHYYFDEDDGETIVGVEYFNENYYFMHWDSDYAAKMSASGAILYSSGLIGIRNKKMVDSSGTSHTLNGSYLITLSGNTFSVNLTNYYNESPDIPTVYSYPSLMTMWDNAELFSETTVDGLDKAFVTDSDDLINNFVSSFFLTDNVSGYFLDNLYVGWKNIDKDGEQMIRFTLETNGGSLSYDFYHFGFTDLPALDSFLDGLSD